MNSAAYITGGSASSRNVVAGEPLFLPIPAGTAQHTWTIQRPDGREDPPLIVRQPDSEGQRWIIRYERTNRPGRYAAQDDRTRCWFAVSPEPSESDLSALSESELRQRLTAPFVYIDNAGDLLQHKTVAPRSEMAASLIGLLFALMLGETLLAAWFGHHQ